MKKEIVISNPEKILPWIGAPFMAAWILEGVILMIGFTPNLAFVNYIMEAGLLFLFGLSYRNKYRSYKAEPNLKISKYFYIELGIHIVFIIGAIIQSAFNVWIGIRDSGLHYRHEYFFISLMIMVSHAVYMSIDYYVSEKAAVIRYCKRIKRESKPSGSK